MTVLVGFLFGAGLWLIVQSFSYPKRSRITTIKRNIWPPFIDEIASGVQVGMSIQEAFFAARNVLPTYQRSFLDRSFYQIQHGVAFRDELQTLRTKLASKDFARLVTILTISSHQGVHQLASLLQDFSSALRRDNELMLEIIAKYQTNKIAARVASVAPLFVLMFTATRSEVRDVYFTQEGILVLCAITLVSIGGYFTMTRIASLPGIQQ